MNKLNLEQKLEQAKVSMVLAKEVAIENPNRENVENYADLVEHYLRLKELFYKNGVR